MLHKTLLFSYFQVREILKKLYYQIILLFVCIVGNTIYYLLPDAQWLVFCYIPQNTKEMSADLTNYMSTFLTLKSFLENRQKNECVNLTLW